MKFRWIFSLKSLKSQVYLLASYTEFAFRLSENVRIGQKNISWAEMALLKGKTFVYQIYCRGSLPYGHPIREVRAANVDSGTRGGAQQKFTNCGRRISIEVPILPEVRKTLNWAAIAAVSHRLYMRQVGTSLPPGEHEYFIIGTRISGVAQMLYLSAQYMWSIKSICSTSIIDEFV